MAKHIFKWQETTVFTYKKSLIETFCGLDSGTKLLKLKYCQGHMRIKELPLEDTKLACRVFTSAAQ